MPWCANFPLPPDCGNPNLCLIKVALLPFDVFYKNSYWWLMQQHPLSEWPNSFSFMIYVYWIWGNFIWLSVYFWQCLLSFRVTVWKKIKYWGHYKWSLLTSSLLLDMSFVCYFRMMRQNINMQEGTVNLWIWSVNKGTLLYAWCRWLLAKDTKQVK